MKLKMFTSATVKLTLIYMGILVIICTFFSINWYRFATSELDEALRRQSAIIERMPFIAETDSLRSVLQVREERLIEGKHNIARQLWGVNILLLLLGGLGSYYMAKRTLAPIEAAHQAQTRFTADASHELRTPLATMQTEIEVALRDTHLTQSEAVALLRSNLEEVARMRDLSTGLLRLASYDGQDLAFKTVAVKKLFDAVHKQTHSLATAKNISVNYTAGTYKIKGNGDSLIDLLQNLVTNAIKYCDEQTTVTVSAQSDKHDIVIMVQDEGIGIAAEDLPHIFDRFYRADSSRTKGDRGGHGLGLAIAQDIATRHGTKLEVSSVLGKGSQFFVKLPKA